MSKKKFDLKEKVDFKIYDVTTWLTNNYNILPNISRRKGNQTMTFGQLIEYIYSSEVEKVHEWKELFTKSDVLF